MRLFPTLIPLLCCLATCTAFLGCQKEKNAASPAPSIPETVQSDSNNVKETPNAEESGTPSALPNDAAEVPSAPPEMPAFNEDSLAKARARAASKRENLPCPKGAKFQNGTCICPAAKGKDGERKDCVLKPQAFPLFSKDFECVPNFWECFQSVMCMNPEGCHTADGIHYGPYYEAGYIVGGVDTSVDTHRGYGSGVCVLDRTDGIPLFSARKDNHSDFACDQEFCPCASDTCILGEICQNGQCMPDNSPLPALTASNSKDIEADSLPKYLDEIPEKTFDTDSCPGGKRYCHAAGTKPMMIPNDDYRCETVASLPNVHRSGLLAWVCQSEACACGDTRCKEGDACMDGVCHHPECHGDSQPAVEPPSDMMNYACEDVASLPGIKKPGLMAWVCQSRYRCECGNTECKLGEACINGKCHKP